MKNIGGLEDGEIGGSITYIERNRFGIFLRNIILQLEIVC